jgi:FkbM family methyltransferase
MSANERYVRAQGELINAGFRPERFGRLVKFVRRFLWPFIRPFHFYELHKIAELESELDKRSALAEEQCATVKQAMAWELEKLVKEHVLLRSDMQALKNRYILMESLDDRISALGSTVETQASRLEETSHRLEEISARLQERAGRHELAITSANFGLYIGKPGEIISDHIFRAGAWDQHILDLAREVGGKRAGLALDVGAHLGSVTVALAGLFKEVVSFEPNDFNFKILSANIAINGLKNVRLFNKGVYSHQTRLALGEQEKQEIPLSVDESGAFDGHSAKNLGAYSFSEQEGGVFGHDANTIDSYHFEDVSFIKVDVQGADGEVLMGALETIRRCRPVVVFEWEEYLSRNVSVSFDSLVRCLSDLGYVVSPLKVHNEKQVDYVAHPHGR